MEKSIENNIVYKLTIEDVQYVSNEAIGRELNEMEIKLLEDKIAIRINWYDAIEDAINESFSSITPE